MITPKTRTRWVTSLGCLLILLQWACASPNTGTQVVSASQQRPRIQRYDLSRDENRGGHTLQRHVAQPEEALRARLSSERNISAASTYTDRTTAELVVAQVLSDQRDRVQSWSQRRSGHPNLVLDYDGEKPIGVTLQRGARTTQPCSHALVVLKWVSEDDFIVLTSYPECR